MNITGKGNDQKKRKDSYTSTLVQLQVLKQTEIKDFYQILSKFRIQNSVEYSEKVGTNKKS